MTIKSDILNIKYNKALLYFTFPSFEQFYFVKHAFTSRLGGVSKGIYATMNMGFTNGDNVDDVYENYARLFNELGLNCDDAVLSVQEHTTNIRVVTADDKGKGIVKQRDYTGVDGLVTNIPNIPLVTFYADCVPVYFLDPIKKVVGTAHAGWRGTYGKISSNMIKVMGENFGCNPSDILVGIGPSICENCYEVDNILGEQFVNLVGVNTLDYCVKKDNEKYLIDLKGINKEILLSCGVKSENITIADLCTKCQKDYLFSHRGHEGKRGNLAAVICLV